jgi:hypothetical protein
LTHFSQSKLNKFKKQRILLKFAGVLGVFWKAFDKLDLVEFISLIFRAKGGERY